MSVGQLLMLMNTAIWAKSQSQNVIQPYDSIRWPRQPTFLRLRYTTVRRMTEWMILLPHSIVVELSVSGDTRTVVVSSSESRAAHATSHAPVLVRPSDGVARSRRQVQNAFEIRSHRQMCCRRRWRRPVLTDVDNRTWKSDGWMAPSY